MYGFCRLNTMFVCHRRGIMFICVKAIQMSKVYHIIDNKSNQLLLICNRIIVIGILVTIVISNV